MATALPNDVTMNDELSPDARPLLERLKRRETPPFAPLVVAALLLRCVPTPPTNTAAHRAPPATDDPSFRPWPAAPSVMPPPPTPSAPIEPPPPDVIHDASTPPPPQNIAPVMHAGSILLSTSPASFCVVYDASGRQVRSHTTPVRLVLEPGRYEIRCVHQDLGLRKTFAVTVRGGETVDLRLLPLE